MAKIPDEDLYPHHPYGNFTHTSPSGSYRFEWTPFTPAVHAWENVRSYLDRAIKDLAEAKQLPGFGLNGLGDEHAELIGALIVLIEDAQGCRTAANMLVEALAVANTEYARSNEASFEQYQALNKVIDDAKSRQRSDHVAADAAERATDAEQDRKIFPFDGKKD